jgi:hypothetical protein
MIRHCYSFLYRNFNDLNTEQQYLDLCSGLIARKLGWLSSSQWRNYEFTTLSEKIFDDTGVQLSPTTLKRVFGRIKYNNLPSTATLNTLARYLGHESWMDFKSSQQAISASPVVSAVIETKIISRKRMILSAAAFAVMMVMIFGFIFISVKSTPLINTANVLFKTRSLAPGLPNTVVFNIDLGTIQSNDIVIQQSWDSTRTVRLQPGQKEATGMYYVPGYFKAKLIVDKKIVKEHDLFITSNQWMATIDHEPVPTYIPDSQLITGHQLNIMPSVIKEIAKAEKPTTMTYHLVKPFNGLHMDDLTLETMLKSSYHEGPAVCGSCKIFLLGTNGAFLVPLSIPGCTGNINLMFNEVNIAGRSHDLSAFGADISQWNKIKMEVRARHVRIYLNDQLIREEDYNVTAGDLAGFRFNFLGAGTVKYIKVFNEKGVLGYEEKFEK